MNNTISDRAAVGRADADRAINQRIFETSLDLILVVDRSGTFIRVSPSSSTVLGYEPEDLVGHSAAGFVHPDDLERTRQEMRLARSGRVTRNFESRYISRDGVAVPLLWTGVWLEEEQRHFFIGRDITQRLKLEHQLRQAQKMEAIGRLTGGIAHDFNNILAVIIGMTEVVAEQVADDPDLSEMVKTIDEAAERGAQLTNRMLAFARQQPLNPRSVDLNEVVLQSTTILRRTLGDDVAVSTALADDLWPVIADPSQIADVVLNLAVNARDAMPQGGRLTIETANAVLDEDYAAQSAEVTPGEYASLVITDSGTGMSPEIVERAFDPFFTTKETGYGTGLGLSMVHGFVKQSRGHVRIYSELGHGTSIKIYLPKMASDAAEAEAASVAAGEEAPVGVETILVVEDAASVRSMAVTILAGLGYRVLEAEDGWSALEVMEQHPDIDLLFTDLVMPNGMSGQDLLARARQRRPDLKALFTSGYSQEFVSAGGNPIEDVPLLRKPYRKKEIATLVRGVLDNGSQGDPEPD